MREAQTKIRNEGERPSLSVGLRVRTSWFMKPARSERDRWQHPRNVTPQHVTPRNATPQHVTPRNVTPQHVTPRNFTPSPTEREGCPQRSPQPAEV
jgi:hypothetical protein